jgi:site-specific DNA recombinase
MDERSITSSRSRESTAPPRIRCAIYTRKSTEEGLEQAFNSLHAQRESAEAYIQSQKQMGWVQLTQHYDDGGFSGGSLDRPGLQQLLVDIDARRVDCVVVYKVDRLSRSLLDFARLMDRFDQRSVSFVSVTQQFNTTSSLGRLTLNILLSFAQFERELISERTRDKMGAARRKGKWVGGTPVLGYDVAPLGGRLVVNDNEARRVREIFALYRKHHSLTVLVGEATRHNWTTKAWKSKGGVRHRGRTFTKASLRLLLTNAVYAGKVDYHGVIYQGEHTAIVDVDLWEAVNAEFRNRQRRKTDSVRSSQDALLTGLLTCKSCDCPMVATYAVKKGCRYRYYVCQSARKKGWQSCPTKSVSATLLEDSVVAQIRDQLRLDHTRVQLQIPDSELLVFLQGESRKLVQTLIEKIEYDGTTGGVAITLRAHEDSSIEVQR